MDNPKTPYMDSIETEQSFEEYIQAKKTTREKRVAQRDHTPVTSP